MASHRVVIHTDEDESLSPSIIALTTIGEHKSPEGEEVSRNWTSTQSQQPAAQQQWRESFTV